MKIKIALLGLFFANGTLCPIYADRYAHPLEADEVDVALIKKKVDLEEEEEEKDETKAENLIKLGITVKISPTIAYQDEAFSTKNSLGANLTFKADVPKAWSNKNTKVGINARWNGKNFTIQEAVVTIGKMVTMGYTSSIFGYKKADPSLPISADATVLQIKYEYAYDWFRMGYALEKAIPLQVTLFDKNKSEAKGDKQEEEPANKLDKDNKSPFQMKHRLPAVGLDIGVVTEQWNIGLSAIGRFTDYTHNTKLNEKNAQGIYYAICYGADLGIEYQVVPKKFTVIGQGVYVHSLGDYLSGRLATIQNEREEMCAAYYYVDKVENKNKNILSSIDGYGFGGTLKYCATPKWTFSIGGSYLTTIKDPQKPSETFRAQWNLVPKIAYEVNKYFTFSGGYSLVKEFKVDEKKNTGAKHALSGSVKFSL